MKGFVSSKIGKLSIGLLIAFLVLGILVPLGILVIYFIKTGDVSGNPQDWSAFGSVMSGSFSLLAAVSTTATLLLLVWQKKDSDKVVGQQVTAMRFEQYVKHRSLFMETLDSIELKFGNAFFFSERDELYRMLFPDNSAFHMSYKGGIFSEFVAGKLQDFWDDQSNFVRDADVSNAEQFCWSLLRLYGVLKVRIAPTEREGDVRVYDSFIDEREDKDVGLNLFNIKNDLGRAEYVVSRLLEFSGRQELYLSMQQHLTDLTKIFENLCCAVLLSGQGNLSFQSGNKERINLIYDLYQYSKYTLHKGERVFDSVYVYLSDIVLKGGGDQNFSTIERLKNVIQTCRGFVREMQETLAKNSGVEVSVEVDGLNFQDIYMKIDKIILTHAPADAAGE